MAQNVGDVERMLRVVGGTLVVLLAYCSTYGVLSWLLYGIGIYLLVSGFGGKCLLRKTKERKPR